MSTTQFFKPLTMEEQFDLCVVGGGLSGVMASLSAAREGKKVLLVEKYGSLGGMATAGMVFPFMRDTTKGSHQRVNAGLYKTLLQKVYDNGGSASPESRQFNDTVLRYVLDKMVQDAGVRVLFHAKLFDVTRNGDRIRDIRVATLSGNLTIKAKIFVDATGNGDLFAFAGLPFEQGRDEDGLTQPMTLNFRIGNVNWDKYDPVSANKLYQEFREQGKIKNPREDLLVFRHPLTNVMHLNCTRSVGKNPTDVFDLTKTEFILREQMMELWRFLKENVVGMEDCELLSAGSEAGIRESRRIVGITKITEDDLCATKKYDDSIARGCYFIDVHNPSGTGTYRREIPDNDWYTIPYTALVSPEMSNLLANGRIISSTHLALSAVRIMPITSCMGEAVGIASALALDGGMDVREINKKTLQEKIVSYGGLI